MGSVRKRPSRAQYQREWKARNPGKHIEYRRRSYVKNRDRELEYRARHKEERKKIIKKWRQENVGKCRAACRGRQAAKRQATPPWANSFFIEEAYVLAVLREKITGCRWHVDHIVPLRSPLVCGLHVENNLRVVPASVNSAKSNHTWPDMPPHEQI